MKITPHNIKQTKTKTIAKILNDIFAINKPDTDKLVPRNTSHSKKASITNPSRVIPSSSKNKSSITISRVIHNKNEIKARLTVVAE